MGVSPSECMGLRKKQTYINAIKIDRDDEYQHKKVTFAKANKSTTQSNPPKTPMDLLFFAAQSNTSITTRSIVTDTPISQPKKPREGLEDITLSVNNTQNFVIKQSLNRQPELKKISKIEGVSWSPIKAEYDFEQAIANIPAINVKSYFDNVIE